MILPHGSVLPRRKSGLLAAIAGAITLHASVCAAQTLPVTDNTAPPYLSVFKENFGTQEGIVSDNFFASWLGRSTIYAVIFSGEYTWTQIEGLDSYVNAWARWCNQHPEGKLILSVPMLPGNETATHARGARGDYDTHFRTLATKLRNAGLCDQIIIRLGWEWNGGWYPWGVVSGSDEDDAPHFAANFCRITTVFRNVAATSTTDPGQMPVNFKFNWCGVRLWSSYNAANAYPGNTPAATTVTGVSYPAYPGDNYVDQVGVDVYDTGTWTVLLGSSTSNNNGIARWRQIALDHNKPFTIPEWGLSTTSGTGNFDNPSFIQNIFNYVQNPANNVLFHSYFDVAAASNHRLSEGPGDGPTVNPNAALKYRQLFTPPMPNRTNIGTISVTTKADGLNVIGAGLGLGGTADNCYFTSRAASSDDLFLAQFTSMSVAAGQAGIAVRQNTTAGAVSATLLVSNGNLVFQSRSSTNGTASSNTLATGVTYPIWLKLIRRSTSITAYSSADGLNWTYAAGQTLSNLSGTAEIGVAVSSGSQTALNTVGVDNVDIPDLKLGQEASIVSKVIKDNADTTGVVWSGAWTTATTIGNRYGADYRSIATTAGTATATFNPGLSSSGLYSIYAHWPAQRTLSYSPQLTVNHASGSSSATLNQEAGWNLWVYIGTWQLNASSNVVLSNGSGTTVADAVLFVPIPAPAVNTINFNNYPISTYSNQDGTHTTAIQDGGATLQMTGNTWKRITYPYTITAATVLEFDYKSTAQGEVQGIGMDTDNGYESGSIFSLYGTDTSLGRQNYHNYSGTDWVHYTIPMGSFYTGTRTYLFFINDKDASPFTNTSYFRNVQIHE